MTAWRWHLCIMERLSKVPVLYVQREWQLLPDSCQHSSPTHASAQAILQRVPDFNAGLQWDPAFAISLLKVLVVSLHQNVFPGSKRCGMSAYCNVLYWHIGSGTAFHVAAVWLTLLLSLPFQFCSLLQNVLTSDVLSHLFGNLRL